MKNGKFWLRVLVSILTCAMLIGLIDWEEFVGILLSANGEWLIVSFLLIHLDRSFMAYKWMILLKSTNVGVSPADGIRAYYVGSFWSTFLPSSVGADAVRTVWLSRKIGSSPEIISSIVIERLFGAIALGFVGFCGYVVFRWYAGIDVPEIETTILIIFVVSLCCVFLIFSRTVHAVVQKVIARLKFRGLEVGLEKVRQSTYEFKHRQGTLLVFLMLSVIEQAFPILGNFTMVRAFSIDLPFVWLMVGIPIVLVVSRMPISIHGFGVQEGAYALVFYSAGVPPGEAVLISIVGRVLQIIACLPGALWTVPGVNENGRIIQKTYGLPKQ